MTSTPNVRKIAILFLLTVGLMLSCETPTTRDELADPSRMDANTPWYKESQVISAVPLSERLRDALHLSVNGVWGAEHSPAYIENAASRGERIILGSQIIAVESRVLQKKPQLKKFLSKDIYSQPARVPWYTWEKDPVYILSIADPEYQQQLIAEGKRYVDQGADGWFLDEIQSSASMIWYERYGGGFNHVEIAAFEDHLNSLGFENIAAYLEARTGSSFARTYSITDFFKDKHYADDHEKIFEEYLAVQQAHALAAMRRIIAEVKDYAASLGRVFAVGANLAGLGNVSDWSILATPIWSEMLDFLVFEQQIMDPLDKDTPQFDQYGSFAPYYVLGQSIVPGFVAALPGLSISEHLVENEMSHYLELR